MINEVHADEARRSLGYPPEGQQSKRRSVFASVARH
jgi:hypothetical protein